MAVLGAFELGARLGHGGMGTVWRARHRSGSLEAAVKVVLPEVHMSDALDRNDPAEAETVRGCCLTHGRRNFVQITDSFPTECKHVLEQIALVYKHDADCRKAGLSPKERLAYHVEHSKPAPDAYLEAARRLAVSPVESLAVEDSVTGMTAALAAGSGATCSAAGSRAGTA